MKTQPNVTTVMISCLILAFWSISPLSAQTPPDSSPEDGQSAFDSTTVVAEIGDRQLTLGELMIRFATLPPEVRARYGSRLDVFLDDVVSNLLVVAEAERLEVSEDPLFETLMEIHREQVLRDLYARRTVLSQVDEPTVRRRYEEQVAGRFERRPRVRLRHILVTPVAETRLFHSDGEDAVGAAAARLKVTSLKERLTTGEISFDALARQASEDASAPDGGDLGWLEPSELDPALAKIAMTLPLGEVSDVVPSALGFHLVEVIDRRLAGQIPLAMVYELLYQEVVGERAPFLGQAAAKDRQRLMQEATVQLFPERLPW